MPDATSTLSAGASIGRRGGPWLSRMVAPVVLLLGSSAVSLALGELALRALLNPGDYLYATMIEDPVLGWRIKPYTSAHDALGFRNRESPDRVGVVAVGDSQTYGVGARREDSWPSQLARLMNEPVYSMALGGFGPLEELYLVEHEAMKRHPRILLLGLYLGNDIHDAYRSAHERPYWHGWRETTSAPIDPAPDEDSSGLGPAQKPFARGRDWLSRYSVLYGFLRARVFLKLAPLEKDYLASRVTRDRQMVWLDPADRSVRTIFTPRRRLSALDPRRSDVDEGLRIAKRAFAAMKEHADASGARLLVVFIPTKERVYCPYLEASGEPMLEDLVESCDVEERVKADLVGSFEARGIAYVDVMEALAERVRNHVQVYPLDSDGHPTAAGHRVIAGAVLEALRRQDANRWSPRSTHPWR